MKKDFRVGIVDYSVYLPEQTITAEELSELVNIPAQILREKMGINRKHVGGPEDHPAMMATKAAKELLKKINFDPKDIDMLIYSGETYCEYVCWTAAIKIQNEIGADNAFAWDMGLRCAATPLALKVARDMMYANENMKNVLIVGGNANAYLVDYKDPAQSFMFDMSPGAFALLLRSGHDENELLGTGIITDHIFCDDVYRKYGGSLHPITEEIAKDPEMLRRANLLVVPDGAGMKQRLAEKSLPDFTGAVRLALKDAGLEEKDIDFIAINHINPKGHYGIMDMLGIDREKTVYLSDDGHCGHADQLLALDYGIKQGKVKDGDICALLGAGTGYAFACSVVRWGKVK